MHEELEPVRRSAGMHGMGLCSGMASLWNVAPLSLFRGAGGGEEAVGGE